MRTFLTIGFLCALVQTGHAAIAPAAKTAFQVPQSILWHGGAVRGGKAGTGFTLIALKTRVAAQKNLERMTFFVGNSAYQTKLGEPGYFNIENRPELNRVQIDFAQTLNAKFDEKELRKIFAQSPFVKDSELIFEPQGQTVSLVLNLRKPAAVRVISVKGTAKKTAQLVVDLFDERKPVAKASKR